MTDIERFLLGARPLDYRNWLSADGLKLAERALADLNSWILSRNIQGDIRLAGRLRRLEWDSKCLGISCARLDDVFVAPDATARERSIWAASAHARAVEAGIRFLSCRLGCEDLKMIRALESAGFRLADMLCVYEGEAQGAEPSDALPADSECFLRRAVAGMVHGRILEDENVPRPRAEEFYLQSCLYHIQNGALVTVTLGPDGKTEGMAIGVEESEVSRQIGRRFGHLWLILVDPTKVGQGIGASLLDRFLRQIGTRMEQVEVATQVSNLSANKLYLHRGLRPVAHLVTMHAWN